MSAEKKKARKAELERLDNSVELVLDGVKELESATASVAANGDLASSSSSSKSASSQQQQQQKQPAKQEKKKDKKVILDEVSDNDSDEEGFVHGSGQSKKMLVHASDVRSMTQRDLMQMAFSNDNVLADFEEEKKRAVEADMPKDEDLTLPGWVSFYYHISKMDAKANSLSSFFFFFFFFFFFLNIGVLGVGGGKIVKVCCVCLSGNLVRV
jgi:U3 small nucleolar RNA-associated protein 14